jgi:hypothetical protein
MAKARLAVVPRLASRRMDGLSDIGWTMIISVVSGLVLLMVLKVLPRTRGDRRRQPPKTQAPPAPHEDLGPRPVQLPATEQRILRAKEAHDDLLAEAKAFERQARGHHHESVFFMERALAKANDAMDVRPDSFDATKFIADLQLDLAQEFPVDESRPHLEAAIAAYTEAIGMRFGNVDCHVGLAWSRMLLARQTEDPADAAGAVAAFERAAEVSPRNLYILRGWAAALDGFLRMVPDGGGEATGRYRELVADHPVAGRDLDEEFYARRRAAEWVIPPVPPLRDA